MTTITGKISQEGTSAPTITILDGSGVTFTTEYVNPGSYIATATGAAISNDFPPKWFIASNLGTRYAIAPINSNQVAIQTYNKNGGNANGILQGNEFKVDIP